MSDNRRARRSPALSRLPRRGYVIREKYLRRFHTLARQLSDTPLSAGTTFDGLLHMGEDGNEIWIEASLSEPEKQFTVVHELVHARRQRSGEDLDDDDLEEPIVELETIARVGKRTLNRMPSGMTLSILHDYLTRGGRDDPETRLGLEAVHRRIRMLLSRPWQNGGGVARTVAAHRRPARARRSRS